MKIVIIQNRNFLIFYDKNGNKLGYQTFSIGESLKAAVEAEVEYRKKVGNKSPASYAVRENGVDMIRGKITS